jgi:GTP-binding protein
MNMHSDRIRNIAIIAHVDHGKTTLVDGMLKQAHIFRENQEVVDRVLDSNDQERERGITIFAKNAAISLYDKVSGQDVKINIVDTPGHADFGGEVERVLNMVDGVLLLVDAAEGPMPQTRFVLKRALKLGHRAVVVINKIDRKGADPVRALNQTFDLFIQLGASDDQADFPVVYTNAVAGRAGETTELEDDLQPLFNAILHNLPAPEGDPDAPFRMLVSSIGYDSYRGATATGRISAGRISKEMPILRIKPSGESSEDIAQYLYTYEGLEKHEIQSAQAGEIIVVAGLEDIAIGETLSDPDTPQALPVFEVEEPTVRMTFGVNSSPFQGRESSYSTSRKLRERLYDELRTNVALRVEDTESAERFVVSGRGELHLAILMENMRREGFEFEVSRPEVILHAKDGGLYEPYEEVFIETSRAALGTVVEILGSRQGQMLDMHDEGEETVRMRYLVPTRGLLGFRHRFLTATRGAGFIHSVFHDYLPLTNNSIHRDQGSLVAWEAGVTTTYGLKNAEERGQLFLGPGVEVYEGMVVGEHQRPGDLVVNVCKKRHVTNHRASFKEIDERLTPPREMSLDEAIEYLGDDELLEITPKSLRIRKRILDTRQREKDVKRTKEALKP